MIINTQDEVLTAASTWWDTLVINPESKLEVLLVNSETEGTLRIARFRSQKKVAALIQAILEAIEYENPRFDVNKWVVENYSE